MKVASSQLKYYIHDGIDACRLQLIGTFSASDVKELEGCWNTARTTLGERKLIVDLAAVDAMDDPGRKWLAVMVAEGARVIEKAEPALRPRMKVGLFRRMFCYRFRTAQSTE
jgi:hypothetical protein